LGIAVAKKKSKEKKELQPASARRFLVTLGCAQWPTGCSYATTLILNQFESKEIYCLLHIYI
jgi:hypothetical protein